MFDIEDKDPKQMADYLAITYCRWGTMKAAFEAQQAVQDKDISACLYWSEVIKILDVHHELHKTSM